MALPMTIDAVAFGAGGGGGNVEMYGVNKWMYMCIKGKRR